jgi:hypothetical protein
MDLLNQTSPKMEQIVSMRINWSEEEIHDRCRIGRVLDLDDVRIEAWTDRRRHLARTNHRNISNTRGWSQTRDELLRHQHYWSGDGRRSRVRPRHCLMDKLEYDSFKYLVWMTQITISTFPTSKYQRKQYIWDHQSVNSPQLYGYFNQISTHSVTLRAKSCLTLDINLQGIYNLSNIDRNIRLQIQYVNFHVINGLWTLFHIKYLIQIMSLRNQMIRKR